MLLPCRKPAVKPSLQNIKFLPLRPNVLFRRYLLYWNYPPKLKKRRRPFVSAGIFRKGWDWYVHHVPRFRGKPYKRKKRTLTQPDPVCNGRASPPVLSGGAGGRAYRTTVLLETNQKLQQAGGRDSILQETAGQLVKLLDRNIIVYPAGQDGLGAPALYPRNVSEEAKLSDCISPSEAAVAEWVYKNNKHAGATTSTLPGAKCLYLAVRGSAQVYAVVGIAVDGRELDIFENNLMISLLGECAAAMEKERLAETKNQADLKAQREQLRANLLRSISHDLRTPLTSISGNAGVLLSNAATLDNEKKKQLYSDIYDDSMWLINLVENLLSVTRIEDGTMNIHMEAELLDEVIAEALRHINRKSAEHRIQVCMADDLIMARMDSRLIIQVIINMVDNAIKYTPKGSDIIISVGREGKFVTVDIADTGSGISDEVKKNIFEMFYMANNSIADSRRSLGLGLALCKSIITAHGGVITVGDNHPHGAVFHFTLPAEEVIMHE